MVVIHLALVVAAALFLGWVALMLLGLVAAAFARSTGCGCLTLIAVVIGVIVVLTIAQ